MLSSGFGFLNTNANCPGNIKVNVSQNLGILQAQNEVGANPADIVFQQTQNIEVPENSEDQPENQETQPENTNDVEKFKAFVIENYPRPAGDVNVETIYAFAVNGQYYFDLIKYSDGLKNLYKSLSSPSINLPTRDAEAVDKINSLIEILEQNRGLIDGMRNFITDQDTATVPDEISISMQSGSNQ